MAYLGGGPRCDGPPLAGPWQFFTGDFIWKDAFFCHFPARIAKFNNVWWSFAFPNFRKMGEFAVSIEHSEAKSVSASGGFAPLTPDQGLCPLTPLGAPPPDPRCRLALHALAMPPLPNPKYATASDLKAIFPNHQPWTGWKNPSNKHRRMKVQLHEQA